MLRRVRSPRGSTGPRTAPTATSSASRASRTCSTPSTTSCARRIRGDTLASADAPAGRVRMMGWREEAITAGVRAEVLLVDDVEENLLGLQALLRRPERSLVAVDSGEGALDVLGRSDFAVVVLDVRLPGLSGFEVAE